MKTSEQTDKIDAALAKAQAEMTNPVYDSTNPHFKSKYASLAGVRNAIIPVLAKHGVACVQELVHQDNKIGCATRLSHAGQWIEFEPFFVPTGKNDAQGFGSASTYARRYSLQAVAGVSGDEDDDANAVSAPGKSKTQKPITEPLSGPIAPTSGVMERVADGRVDVIDDYVTRLQDAFVRQDEISAVELVGEIKDADEKVAVWSFLNSKERSFIKRAMDAQQPTKEAA
jgi:hypothetical protein